MRGDLKNINLRKTAKKAGVCFWQIAALWGVSEAYMTRFMRRDLTEDESRRFLDSVEQLKQDQA